MFGVEGARLLRDKRSGETLKGAMRQGAHRLPRGKRSAWSGNQLHSKTWSEKTAFFYNPVTKTAHSFDKFRFSLYMRVQFNDNRSNIQ
ncbi:hypothetical protein QUF49_07035 [Fictibacillus sp. b24]|uniref:hypothetical protein n=1 Tax=Fictibacillus sp. b24 TaxID=3055863 RepID=UPI0025A1B772|nr:hypothetical protein [Fictibacillus sp. b24]MDM5315746.1 hypothetical protein [Fictibacillus sp. b24]